MKLYLTTAQNQIIQNPNRFRIIVAGRRWGKTELALYNMLISPKYGTITHNDYMSWYVAPTYKQAKQIAWEKLKRICGEFRYYIKKINESELYIQFANNSSVHLKGAENKDTLVGVGLNFVNLDEYSLMKEDVWGKIIRPMLSDKKGGAMFTGTPRGYNHLYDIWQKGNNKEKDYHSWHYKTIDSPFIDPEEVELAKNDMDEKTFRQEYEASFENMQGRVYYCFDREKNIKDIPFMPNYPIILMVDFNVNPMKWALGYDINGELLIFDEVVKYDTNTPEMVKEVKKRYPNSFFFIYGDRSGGSRDTRSITTDYEIIRRELLSCQMKIKKANPPVIDRINAVNGLLLNTNHKSRLFIDPKCKHAIKDFEQVVYVGDTREIDKNINRDLTHISDAIGYFVEYEYPIKKPVLYVH